METSEWGALAGALALLIGAIAELLRRRSKRTADSKRTIVPVDDATGTEDTGRFIVAMQNAPAETLEDVARSYNSVLHI